MQTFNPIKTLELYKEQSLDPDKKVACFIGVKDSTLAYKFLPEVIGVNKILLPEFLNNAYYFSKPIKKYYVEHAERVAIFEAVKRGISLVGKTMYVTFFPCADCARSIIMAGIKAIICPEIDIHSSWQESNQHAKAMLEMANVEIITLTQEEWQQNLK